MKNIKNTLAHLDSDLLAELLDAAQFALNDSRTVKRVAAELDVPAARLRIWHTSLCSFQWNRTLCQK